MPEDRSFDTEFNLLDASPKDLVGVGIEQRVMLHRMLATFGSVAKPNSSPESDSDPFRDDEFDTMYNMTVRKIGYFLALCCVTFVVSLSVELLSAALLSGGMYLVERDYMFLHAVA
jgi:hypothetical protein